jgi:hypothetical protein
VHVRLCWLPLAEDELRLCWRMILNPAAALGANFPNHGRALVVALAARLVRIIPKTAVETTNGHEWTRIRIRCHGGHLHPVGERFR